MIARSVFVQYCDDVRQEVGGKVSFMGIYGTKLLVAEIPTVLPKLFVMITAVTDASEPFRSLTFRVLQDDATLFEEPAELPEAAQLPEPDQIMQMRGLLVPMMPFVIEKPFRLRVRVATEREELKGNGLSVELAPKS